MTCFRLAAVLSAVMAASSCSTMGDAAVSGSAETAAGYLESGNISSLMGGSAVPFLFETEVLPAPAQLEALWEGLAASGFDFSPDGEITVLDVDEDTWKRFSTSRDVEVWFRRHAPRDAALAVWTTEDGEILLVMDRRRKSDAPWRGLKVVNR